MTQKAFGGTSGRQEELDSAGASKPLEDSRKPLWSSDDQGLC